MRNAHVTTGVHLDDGTLDVLGNAQEPSLPEVDAVVLDETATARPYARLSIGNTTFFIHNPDTLHAIALAAVGAKGELNSALAYQVARVRDEG